MIQRKMNKKQEASASGRVTELGDDFMCGLKAIFPISIFVNWL